MQSIINKIKENIVDRIIEVFWVTIKAAVITAIILLLLRTFPPEIKVGVRQSGGWDAKIRGDVDVGVRQSDNKWYISN